MFTSNLTIGSIFIFENAFGTWLLELRFFSFGVFASVDIVFKTTFVFDKKWQGNILLIEAGVACVDWMSLLRLRLEYFDLCISLSVFKIIEALSNDL